MKKPHTSGTLTRIMFAASLAVGALAACSGAKEEVLVGNGDSDAGGTTRDAMVASDDASHGGPDATAKADASTHPGDASAGDASAPFDATTTLDESFGHDAAGTCPYDVDPVKLPSFVPPRAQDPGACSSGDIAIIQSQAANPNSTPASIHASLAGSPSCQACLFSNAADATWQLFVWQPDAASGQALYNTGACTADSPGAHPACAAAMQKLALCQAQACPSSCSEQCLFTANDGTCHDEASAFQFSCSSVDITHCNGVAGAAQWMCGPAVAGGGGNDAG